MIDLGPVVERERIATLDVLRGFAVLGILVMNIQDFAGPAGGFALPIGMLKPSFVGWHRGLDTAIFAFKYLFVEGKMRALFSMLFGASAVMITERIVKRGHGDRAGDIFSRRTLWLLLFGLLHAALIWDGDILFEYAVYGLIFLYPLRILSARTLAITGLSVSLGVGTIATIHFYDTPGMGQDLHAHSVALQHRTLTADQVRLITADADAVRGNPDQLQQMVHSTLHQTYWSSVAQRSASHADFEWTFTRSFMDSRELGAMILGMALYKAGFLTGRWSRRRYLITALANYAIVFPIVGVGLVQAFRYGLSPDAIHVWLRMPSDIQEIAGAVGNAALLLYFSGIAWLRSAVRLLGAVGRAALSNYILTSIICQTLFLWGPWKLYGQLYYFQQMIVVLGVWAVNLIVSPLWFRCFQFGPLEWLWRSLTYWRRQPFLRTASRPTETVAVL